MEKSIGGTWQFPPGLLEEQHLTIFVPFEFHPAETTEIKEVKSLSKFQMKSSRVPRF
jgi:hypothetical protein